MDFNFLRDEEGKLHYPSLLYASVAIWPSVGFLISLPQVVVYGAPLLYAAYCFFNKETYDWWFLALLAYIPVELLLASPPSLFQSWPRYVLFSALIMCVSPIFQGEKLRMYRERIFLCTMWACVFLGVGSFIGWFLGINFMISSAIDFITSAGTFGGLTHHSMMLGPIAGVGACFLVSKAFMERRYIWWVGSVAALFAIAFSASRSALMAALVGIFVTLYRQSGSTSNFLKVGLVTFIIAASTYSLWEGALSGLIKKNQGTSALNYDSRQKLWDERIAEFKSSPIYGVGFCAAKIYKNSSIDKQSGRLESGTSWLIIFSMLGIIGAYIVITLFVRAFLTAYKGDDSLSPLICGILALFFVHMFAEGYVFAGGSFLAFMLWLTIGVAMDSIYKTEVCD